MYMCAYTRPGLYNTEYDTTVSNWVSFAFAGLTCIIVVVSQPFNACAVALLNVCQFLSPIVMPIGTLSYDKRKYLATYRYAKYFSFHGEHRVIFSLPPPYQRGGALYARRVRGGIYARLRQYYLVYTYIRGSCC